MFFCGSSFLDSAEEGRCLALHSERIEPCQMGVGAPNLAQGIFVGKLALVIYRNEASN